jgi:hypothetical protein
MREERVSRDAEIAELMRLARSLSPRTEAYRQSLDDLIERTRSEVEAAQQAIDHESISERFARALRQLWLEACAFSTSNSYRSPPTREATKTPTGRRIDFGYERDLQPAHLEQRCWSFFDPTPAGWSADHILFSSGQSTMAALLLALDGSSVLGNERPLTFVHFGSYFETSEILSLFRSLVTASGRGREAVDAIDRVDGDIVIVEPVYCDGSFGAVDVTSLTEKNPRRRAYVFDNTLCGLRFAMESHLAALARTKPAAVFRIFSGLKLFQAGLELSGVGILSVFTHNESAPIPAAELGARIRRIRTLLGLGLTFQEVAALEAPWFLDRQQTHAYEAAVFENNAALARAVADTNRLFDGVFHPSLLTSSGAKGAPYSAFRLKERDVEAYDVLEQHILKQAQRRGLAFDLGGSFGFRGHRFEVVRPETGEEPFLRVALGRRVGGSRDQIIQLMAEVASASNVAQLAQTTRESPTTPLRPCGAETSASCPSPSWSSAVPPGRESDPPARERA